MDTYVVSASGKPTIIKDPDADLDYTFDWTEWLDALGDALVSHEIIVPTGITLDSSSINGKKVIAWLSGGTAGETYQVTCRITTIHSPPRVDDRSIYVKVKER